MRFYHISFFFFFLLQYFTAAYSPPKQAAHLAHVALLSAPHTTSSESSALPPPPAPSSPVAEAKNGQTSRAEARRVLWYAAVDGSSTAAVTVLAHLLVSLVRKNALMVVS